MSGFTIFSSKAINKAKNTVLTASSILNDAEKYDVDFLICGNSCIGHIKPQSDNRTVTIDKIDNHTLLLFGEAYISSEGETVNGYINCRRLLQELLRKGSGFLKDLGGEFAGVLIDQDNNKISVFNDQFGLFRIFLSVKGNSVSLSNEMKTLALNLGDNLTVNPRGFAELLSCGCTIGSQSLFNSIEILPEASWVEVQDGKILERKSYFTFDKSPSEHCLSLNDFNHDFIKRFNASVLQCFSDSESSKPGISLTGGLDSRMVLSSALYQNCFPRSFTFGSSVQNTVDVEISSRISELSGIEHYPIIFDEDFKKSISRYLLKSVSISEGCIGVDGAAELYGNEKIRKNASVRITGNYGSELLRGICAFKYGEIEKRIVTEDLDFHIDAGRKSFNEMMTVDNRVGFIAYQQAQHQGFGRHTVERSQIIQRTPFLDPQLLKIISKRPDGVDVFHLMKVLIAQGNPSFLDVKSDRGYLGKESGIKYKLIRNQRELMFKLEYFMGYGASNFIIRFDNLNRALGIENAVIGRNKFSHMRQWYRDLLRPLTFEILTDPVVQRILPFVDFNGLQKILNLHYTNRENHTVLIDRLLSVVLFFNSVTRRK